MHQASNPEYLDKNYGDMLIIWDKLFGTFQRELGDVPIQYGLTRPLKSYSFLWQHFHFFAELILAWRHTQGFRNKFSLLFGKPDSLSGCWRDQAEALFRKGRHPEAIFPQLNRYAIWQTAASATVLFLVILFEQHIPAPQQVVWVLVLFLTLINIGAVLEQKKWIFYLEFARILLSLQCIYFVFPQHAIYLLLIASLAGLLLPFPTVRQSYLNLVYAPATK